MIEIMFGIILAPIALLAAVFTIAMVVGLIAAVFKPKSKIE